jgi:hypothetical protein
MMTNPSPNLIFDIVDFLNSTVAGYLGGLARFFYGERIAF